MTPNSVLQCMWLVSILRNFFFVTNCLNKLVQAFTGKLFHHSLIYISYISNIIFDPKRLAFSGELICSENLCRRLGWKGLPGTNTLQLKDVFDKSTIFSEPVFPKDLNYLSHKLLSKLKVLITLFNYFLIINFCDQNKSVVI